MTKTITTDRTLHRRNVFILNTGRCGSTTFIKACNHISNYTCGHETRSKYLGSNRLDYPEGHIEADNRLSWFLGKLDTEYGDQAIYVHLQRDPDETARSYARRYPFSIVKAYRQAILMGASDRDSPQGICRDYVDTVNTNIQHFLKDKTRTMVFRLEQADQDFREFWKLVGAEGDLSSALNEFGERYNRSQNYPTATTISLLHPFALARKLSRLIRNLPNFIKHA